MKIILVSDIHVDDYSRFASVLPDGMNSRLFWTVDIFDQILEYCKEHNIRTVCIGGDLFDKRGTISVAAYDAVYDRLLKLREANIVVYSIVGNHDQANREGTIHSLKPLPMEVIEDEYFFGIGFVSFKENPQIFLKSLKEIKQKSDSKLMFWLIHQGVNGAKIAGDEILSRDEVSIHDIRKVIDDDLVFSGHYHIHQKVDKNFYYVGSAVPKDFGDTTPKGFLVFDTESKQVEQIESRAPKFVVIENADEVDQDDILEIAKDNYLKLEYNNKEPEAIGKLTSLSPGYVAVKSKVEREYEKRSSIDPDSSPIKAIQSYLSDMCEKQILHKALQSKALEFLQILTEGKTIEASFGGHKVEIQKAELTNFMSYHHSEFDLTSVSSMTLIEGSNTDDPSAISNGSGKSCLPEAIKWCLYGTTARGITGDDVINNSVGKNCFVKLDILIDGEQYTITRYRKHTEEKNQIVFKKKSGKTWIDLRGKSDSETQEKIIKYCGIDENTFDNTVFFGHGFTKSFAGLSDKEQKSVLENILGIGYFNDLLEACRSNSSELKDKYNEEKIGLTYQINRSKEFSESLDKSIKLAEDYETNREFTIKQLQVETDNYSKLISESDSSVEEYKQQVIEIKNNIDIHSQDIESRKEAEQLLRDLNSDRNSIESDLSKKKNQISILKDKISDAKEKLEKSKSEEESTEQGVCPTCGQDLVDPEKQKEHLEKLKSSQSKHSSYIKEASQEIERLSLEISKLSEKHKTTSESMSETYSFIKQTDDSFNMIKKLQIELNSAEKELSSLQNSKSFKMSTIDKNNKRIFDLQNDPNPHFIHVEDIQEKLSSCEKSIEDSSLSIKKMEEEIHVWKFWETAFSDKGTPQQSPLKSYMFDSIVPVLDELSRKYSEILTSGSIDVQFNTVTALKSGELRDKFSVAVLNKYGSVDYKGDSGGERRKVDLIIMFALHSLAKIRSGSTVDILFLDEILDSLDQEGCNRVMDLLKQVSETIKKIFVITHNDNLKQMFGSVMRIEKRNGISKLVNL